MQLGFKEYIEIFWVLLQILAVILNSLVDREAGLPSKDEHPLIDYRVNGSDSILMHLPRLEK